MSHIHEKFGIFQYAHFELPLKNIHEIMPEASLELFRIFWFLAIRREIRPFLDMPIFLNAHVELWQYDGAHNLFSTLQATFLSTFYIRSRKF